MQKLTVKQEAFCLAYMETGNASEAYRRAYDASKMKPESVNRKAKELTDNVKISARMDELRAAAVKRNEVTVDKIIRGLANLAFFDVRVLFNEDGSLKQITELDEEVAQALAGFDIKELFAGRGDERKNIGRTKKIRLVDRKSALDSLARIKGMFLDKVEHSGKIDVAGAIQAARKRSGK